MSYNQYWTVHLVDGTTERIFAESPIVGERTVTFQQRTTVAGVQKQKTFVLANVVSWEPERPEWA